MDPTMMLFFIIAIVMSAIIHEYMHGWMANELGDPTAKYAGRLTLNPKAHIDPFGSVILPLMMVLLPGNFLFAYAKPVPYNPYNLKDQRWGPVWVALVGPLSNVILAFVFGLAMQLLPVEAAIQPFLYVVVIANVVLAIFNMVPIPPLDGSKLLFALMPDSMWRYRVAIEKHGIIILLFFLFFGLELIAPIIEFFTTIFITWMSLF